MADLITARTTSPLAEAGPRRRPPRWRNTLIGWSFILPNFLGFVLITLIPVIAAFALAFTNWDSYTTPEWVGLKNFRRLLHDDSTKIALRNTLYYAAGHMPLTLGAALGLAVLLNRKIPGVAFFRAAAFFPYVTSPVAVALVWNMLFSPDSGPVNQLLRQLGGPTRPGLDHQYRLGDARGDPDQCVAGHGLLHGPVPGRAAGDPDRAVRGGAGWTARSTWQRFRTRDPAGAAADHLPGADAADRPSFKVFDLIMVMTNGGPGRATRVLSQRIYRTGITTAVRLRLGDLAGAVRAGAGHHAHQFWFNKRRSER